MGKKNHPQAEKIIKGKHPAKTKQSIREISKRNKAEVRVEPAPKSNKNSETKTETWSKSKKKRMRMLRSKMEKKDADESEKIKNLREEAKEQALPVVENHLPSLSCSNKQGTKHSKLQNEFAARLTGSRFRLLNEELYTTTSKESFDRFSKNPELFDKYHEGFRHQVESWPVNPVDVIVRWLSFNYRNNNQKKNSSSVIVADFGCGDAQLAKDLLNIEEADGKCPFQVHSFDLVSRNELVTACDMAKIPLGDKSVDVCVFCLSLMGTNLADFIREAHRVLKENGRVKIAEVRSRIEYSHSQKGQKKNNKAEETKSGTLQEFINVLQELGFDCIKKDLSNKMFLLLELKKNGKNPNEKLSFSAKPCIYKRR